MFNRFKKFIAILLCSAVFNACVLPSATLFAVKRTAIRKQQVKLAEPQVNETETEEEEPTVKESWHKFLTLKWRSLTKADAWNIGKSTGGTLSACALAYVLFKSASGADPLVGPTPDIPDDKPEIPAALKNILENDQYGPEYDKKIKDLCDTNYCKQLQAKGLIDLQNQLIKDMAESSDQSETNIKNLIDHHHKILQKHLDKGKIQKKPEPLYARALKTKRLMIPVTGQSGASCGYHAVLNAVLSVSDIDESQAHKIINEKFAQKNGTWRAPIIKSREQKIVKNYLYGLIHTCMQLDTKEEETAWTNDKAAWDNAGWWHQFWNNAPQKPMRTLNADERRSLGRIVQAYACTFVLDKNLSLLKENPANLEAQLQEIIRQDRPHITQAELDNITGCIQTIDLTKLSIEIASADELVGAAHAYAKKTNQKTDKYKTDLETDLYGDNLNTQEIEHLKAIACEEYGIDNDRITIIDNTNLLKTEAYQDLLNPARQQLLNNPNCKHAFCIRKTANNGAYNAREVQQLTSVVTNANNAIAITQQEIIALQVIIDSDVVNAEQKKQAQATLQAKTNTLNQTQKAKNNAESRQTAINERLSADTGSTHWIQITVDHKGEENTYPMKDSMGGDYTNHPNALQLIDALEQQQNHVAIIEGKKDGEDDKDNSTTTPTDTGDAATKDKKMSEIDKNLLDAINGTNSNKISIKSTANKQATITDPNTNAKKEIINIPLIPSTHPETMASIQTIAQSGSSCAYHALKNADDILHILQTPEVLGMMLHDFNFEEIAAYISHELCSNASKDKITMLFDEKNRSGEWRNIIRAKRLPSALKESIFNKLLNSVPRTEAQIVRHNELMATYTVNKKTWDEKLKNKTLGKEDRRPQIPILPYSTRIDNAERQCLRNIAQVCTDQLINTNNTISLSKDSNLQETLVDLVLNNKQELLLDRQDDYNQCIALLNADELEKNFGQEITINSAVNNAPLAIGELIGNDLDPDELDALMENHHLENAHNISIIARTETSEFVAGNAYALADVIDIVKTKMLNNNCVHAFLLRSGFSREMDGFGDEVNQSDNGTHWICVILHRVNGHNHYIIADSLNSEKANRATTPLNKNYRTRDGDVNYLKAMLES